MNSQPRVRISPAPPLTPLRNDFRHIERGVPDGPAKAKQDNETVFSYRTSAKLPHDFQPVADGFLSVSEASKRLGKSVDTIYRWCEEGRIPAFPKRFGTKTTYRIPVSAIVVVQKSIEDARNHKQTSAQISKPHAAFFDAWVEAMRKGLMTGKPFSTSTVEMYTYYVEQFLAEYLSLSTDTLTEALLRTDPAEYCKRFKLYKSLVSFGKFLISKEMLDKLFLDEVKPLYPKRHTPPKRPVIDESQLKQLLVAAKTPFQRMMLTILGGTGIRVAEAVALKRADVCLEKQTLVVRLGKGNKTRTVGLSQTVIQVIAEHYEVVASAWAFSNEEGQQLTRMGLYHRLKRLGERAGVKVAPHALRRAFVTFNANKGRPLQMLQKACGHSDIKTTMSYCMTSEQEVVEAMKGWE